MREDLRRDYDVSIGQLRMRHGRNNNKNVMGFSSWKGPFRPQALFVDENACIGCTPQTSYSVSFSFFFLFFVLTAKVSRVSFRALRLSPLLERVHPALPCQLVHSVIYVCSCSSIQLLKICSLQAAENVCTMRVKHS